MKKNILFVALLAATLCSCDQFGNKKADESAQLMLDSLQRIIDEKDVELDDIMGSINEVQEGIRRINEAQGRVTIADGNRESASSKEVIRENMEFIQEAMQQNRDMIAQLKEKQRTSTLNADKLAKTIESSHLETLRYQELLAREQDTKLLLTAQCQNRFNLFRPSTWKRSKTVENENLTPLTDDESTK